MRYFRAGRGEQGNRVRRPGIRVANEAGLQNIITEAQVLKCQCVRVCVRVCVCVRLFDPGLQVSVGASDAAGIIRLPKKKLSTHNMFLLRMLLCVPGFMLILGFAKG